MFLCDSQRRKDMVNRRLADPSLLHCLARARKYGKHLRHDLPKQRRHFGREWDASIAVEALEEKMNALEEIGQCFIARGDILHRLG
jgi:hypothetical protein